MPWSRNCEPGCGKARKIKVLKKHSFECPTCKYSWEVCKPEIIELAPIDSEATAPEILKESTSQDKQSSDTVPPAPQKGMKQDPSSSQNNRFIPPVVKPASLQKSQKVGLDYYGDYKRPELRKQM